MREVDDKHVLQTEGELASEEDQFVIDDVLNHAAALHDTQTFVEVDDPFESLLVK